jgi:hypothetical protein
MTRLMVSREFPQEITKACSREQVSELIRASARYMWTAIGTYLARDGVKLSDEKTSGVTDPAAASMLFEVSVATTDEARVTKDVQVHWNNLVRAIKRDCLFETGSALPVPDTLPSNLQLSRRVLTELAANRQVRS